MIVDVVGWAGAALILAAYALLSAGRLAADGVAYQLMNVGGAAGLLVNGWVRGALPSAALNLIWMAIGIVVLVRRRRAGRTHTRVSGTP